MRNLFKNAIYLFDMSLDAPTIITSKADSNYELHVIPTFEYPYDDHFLNNPNGIKLLIYVVQGGNLIYRDEFSGAHQDDQYFFDILKWFNREPKNYIETIYNDRLIVTQDQINY